MKSFEKICDLVTSVIEANFPERLDSYDLRLNALSKELKENSWEAAELIDVARDAFTSDVQLHMLFLSSLYLATSDDKYLVRIEELLMTDSLDISMTCALYLQTRYYRFSNGKNDDYPFLRTLHRHISNRFMKDLRIEMDPVPYEMRNHDLVFVVTYQLLEERHAPSRIVLSLCYYLQKYFGYQVQLLVMAEPSDVNDVAAYWAGDIITPAYMPEWGDQCVNFRGENIYYYQFDLNKASRERMLDVIGKLYNKRPEFILQFGGLPRLDQLWRSMSTFIAIPAGNNYEASDAQLLVSYQQSNPEGVEAYLQENHQNFMKMNLVSLPLTETALDIDYSKKGFGIDENSFAIAIIGNRLDDEITPEFKDVLSRIVAENDDVVFVIIGNYELSLPEDIDSHTIRLGYREDFIQTILITDLFLNPKRSGGAGGALRALNSGIPVITLPSCDVSAFVGEDFTCDNYDEMVSLVHKYITDKDFYDSQSEKARTYTQNSTPEIDMEKELRKLIDTAIEIAKANEVTP